MRTHAWKNNCGSFSAVRDKNGKIEVLVNEKNWGHRSGAKRGFRFGEQGDWVRFRFFISPLLKRLWLKCKSN